MKAEGKNELVLGEGEWRVEKGDTLRGEGKYFLLDKSTKIIGQGRGLTTLVGVGLKIQGNKSDGIVEIQDLTIKGGEKEGLFFNSIDAQNSKTRRLRSKLQMFQLKVIPKQMHKDSDLG